jgi:hypothetical protein
MANHYAINSCCQSLSEYLKQRHGAFVPSSPDLKLPAASFAVLSSSTFSGTADPYDSSDIAVTLFLHRVAINNHLRNIRTGSPVGPLGLDLHLLLTIWATKAEDEHVLLAWAMRELHFHAFLDRSSLGTKAGWAVDEQVNIVPADLSAEEMQRIWDVARRGYRLSYPFIARIVRIGPDKILDGAPVVAVRMSYTDNLEETVP